MFKYLNKYVIILVGFYIFWLCVLPQVFLYTVSAVCKNLSHNTDYKIEVINPRIRLDVLPVVRVYADKISVNSKNDKFSVDIDKFKIKFRILPLLSSRFHINSIKADNVYAVMDIKQDIELDKDFFSKLEKTKVICNALNVSKFNILMHQKDAETPVEYSGDNLTYINKNRYVLFKIDSRLVMDGKKSDANLDLYLPRNNDLKQTVFDMNVKNLDISPFRIYFRHYLPEDLENLNGILNIDADKDTINMVFKNCSAVMKDSAKSIIFPNELILNSKFKIKRHKIYFDSVNIDSDNIHVAADGTIYDYWGKTMPTLDLKVRVNKSRVEDFVNLLPPFVVEDLDAYKLKKYKFYGDALANISIRGRLPEPELHGNVFINNGILTKPIPNTSSGAVIKLTFTGKYANYDVFVPAGGSERVAVKGSVELYNIKYSDLTVKSSDHVNLTYAQDVVNPLHEILNFVIGPVPIMDIKKGTGNIDITVKGNRKNPHVWGNLNFYDTYVNFKEIPDLLLEGADAELIFNDEDAVFTTKKGIVNGKDFKINGYCDLSGKFDFDVNSQNQPIGLLYKAINTASLIPEFQKMLPKFDKAEGFADLNLKIFGNVKYIEDLKFNENAFAKGEVLIKGNNYEIQNIKVENANGKINLDSSSAEADIKAEISSAPLSIKAKIKNDIADLVLNIPKINPNFVLEDKRLAEKQYLPFVSVFLKYRGNINDIEYDRINMTAKVQESNPKSIFKFTSGEASLINNKLTLKNLKGYIKNEINQYSADLKITNTFSSKADVEGNVYFKTPNVAILNDVLNSGFLPENIMNTVKSYELTQGALNFNGRISSNKLNADINLDGISFVYIPLDLPVNILNGKINIRNNTLNLNKINILADKMPILVDGDIKDLTTKQNFDLYINSKPQQEFIDKYINKNQIYPLKIKGDIVYWAKLKGNIKDYSLKTQFNLSKDSYVYYLGATIGDVENAISLYIDSKINGRNLKIKEFNYDKVIDSLSGRQTKYNLLKAYGGVELLQDDLLFRDLHIKTFQPTDARIFNIIFRKPNIKQGQFTSDLRINDKLSNPRVLGKFKIFETNIPFIDVTVKNIELLFKDRTVEIASNGDIMGNVVKFEGVLKNKLTMPYHIEKAALYTNNLDLNSIATKLKTSQIETQGDISVPTNYASPDLFTANNFKLKADAIELRNIHATNFEADFSYNSKGNFDVNNFAFNIAQGMLNGKYKYNFNNSNMNLSLDAANINANDITLALFDLKNQIYGDMTGTVNLSCIGKDFKSCMASLSGNTIFNVKDGRMPKLGSLEYLLKAGNLLKGGITGLSINSIIDIITPLKTGEFSDIFGSITIKDGLANNIEITTKGKDLSLFISGTYNFATENADMEVLGLLSRKISTMFGPIGNLSINTLFNVIPWIDLSKDSPAIEKINKIPGFEISNKAYRKFLAVIKGNINGDNYVTNFSWIN